MVPLYTPIDNERELQMLRVPATPPFTLSAMLMVAHSGSFKVYLFWAVLALRGCALAVSGCGCRPLTVEVSSAAGRRL